MDIIILGRKERSARRARNRQMWRELLAEKSLPLTHEYAPEDDDVTRILIKAFVLTVIIIFIICLLG